MGDISNPGISVVIPAFNAQRYIEVSIASALAQSNVSVEVIVVDDASSDETAAIVERISKGEPRLKLLRNKENRGPSYSRNRAIKHARGDWIALLDADDYFDADRLHRLVQAAETEASDFLADNINIVTDAGETLGTAFEDGDDDAIGWVSIEKLLRTDRPLTSGVKLGFVKPLMRVEFLRSHGIAYRDDVRVGEDFLLYAESLLNGGRFLVIKDALYFYRLAEGSITRRREGAIGRTRQLLEVNNILLNMPEIASNPELSRRVTRRGLEYEALILYSTLLERFKKGRLLSCTLAMLKRIDLCPDLIKVVKMAVRRKVVVLRGGVSSFQGLRFPRAQ